ncbi:MAG: hypothetical protein ACYTXT_06090 [Nostoc sp.]
MIGSIALGTVRLLLRGKLLPLPATGDRSKQAVSFSDFYSFS